MEEAFKYVVEVSAAGLTIVPLFATIFVINATLQGLGKLGAVIGGIKGQGLRKKASDYADYRKNVRRGNALAGQRTVGGGRFRREYRRELRNQAAEAAVKSGQAQFGTTDTKAGEYVQSIAQSNAAAQAINNAQNTTFAKNLATNPNLVREGMGEAANNDEVKKALAAQQSRAMADAIKDVELSASAEIRPGDVETMATRMAEAIKKGDSIGAQAYQNMLMRSGGPGTKAYRDVMTNPNNPNMLNEAGLDQAGASAMTAVKRNMLMNHGGVKETAADLVKHASSSKTLAEVSGSADTWKMSNDDLVRQKTHSLQMAESAGGISQDQAKEIQKDNQLYRKLDKEGQQVIDRVAQGVEGAHAQAIVEDAHIEALKEQERRNSGGSP